MNSIFVVFAVLDFFGFQVQNAEGICILIPQLESEELRVFIDHHGLKGTSFESLHGVLHAVDNHMSVLGDFLVEFRTDLLLPCEFLPFHALRRQFDCLVKTVFTPVRSVHDFYHFGKKTGVEFLVFVNNRFEVRATR